jgi:hypothetical protein
MKSEIRRIARKSINALVGTVGLQLVPHEHGGAIQSYFPLKVFLKESKAAGLSVGEYVDRTHSKSGATQETIDGMAALGVFDDPIERVCEIGPGTGRYTEKTIQACHPASYEIYEPARDWSNWLAQTYHVTAHPCDGMSLAQTPTASIDLIQAHKVFVYLPFLVTCRYFCEMARVVRRGGKVVFDIVTEACMDDATLAKWIGSGVLYPLLMARAYAVNFLCKQGFTLNGSFFIDMKPGVTECFVFTRQPVIRSPSAG